MVAHDDREEAGHEDAEQAEEDQVVRRVGQRAGVAALVDVDRDVPVHPEHRGKQRDGGDGGGKGDPAGEAGGLFAVVGEPLQGLGAAGAMTEAEVEKGGGDDHRRHRRDHDLSDFGASGRRGRGRGENRCEVDVH